MKKRFTVIFSRIFLIITFLSIFTFQKQANAAASKIYYLSRYDINLVVNSDGSADFEERLTYNFQGQFNGVLRDVDFSSTKGIKNKRVYVVEANALKELKLNSVNSFDSSGNKGTYNYIEEENLARFKIFEASQNQEKTFVISYKLLDVVTKYSDIAEFNRKVIDTKWQTRLDNITIKITLPQGATKEELKVFAHGPLTGESSIIDNSSVEFKVPTISPGTFVETLVLFPTRLVPGAGNIVNENALPIIMENEAMLADRANKTREEAKKLQEQNELKQKRLRYLGNPLAILLMLIWVPILIYLYRKYDKEFNLIFKGKYYRELPGEYTPAEMSVLMSSGKVNTRDIMATLMDLTRKKQLVISQNKLTKKGLLGNKEVIEYIITLKEKTPTITLKNHEEFLINWFVGKIGNGDFVSLDDIKSYVKNKKQALAFKTCYDKWTQLVKGEAAKNKFFDDTCKEGTIRGILIGIAYLLVGTAITALMVTPIAVIAIIQGAIMVIFAVAIKRRSKFGNEQHAMWMAFKNFLKDFSRLDKAEIPAIILWEHYLVYAISLGVAKEVIRQLPIVFKDDDLNNNQLTYMYGANYGYFIGFGAMFDDTIHVVEGAISTAQSVANSQNSSASGGGGGFSGGSSGGGGGGGGGGAF